MVAAEAIAELLPKKFLGVPGFSDRRPGKRTDPRPDLRRGLLLLRRDETFLAHALKHDAAPAERAIEIRPWRER
jgi:hypothetical protein